VTSDGVEGQQVAVKADENKENEENIEQDATNNVEEKTKN